MGTKYLGRARSRKPVVEIKKGAYTRFFEGEKEEIVYCGYDGLEIKNPRKEKGQVVKKFCNRTCKDRFHNRARYTMVKQLMDFLGRSGFLTFPATGGRSKR